MGDDLERRLADDLAAFIGSGGASDAAFDALARRLFAYQVTRNAPYRRFCEAQGLSPERVTHWSRIPPAPAAAFKHQDLSCTPVEAAARVFHSSGTTGRAASRHYLSPTALGIYDLSLRADFARFVLPDGACLPIWALVPPAAAAPHSSLSHMIASLMAVEGCSREGEAPATPPRHAEHGSAGASPSRAPRRAEHGSAGASPSRAPRRAEHGSAGASPSPAGQPHRFFWNDTGPDVAGLAAALERIDEPVLLFGTAFAWVIFFDGTERRFALPEGSRVLETGGFKGRSREIPREELYALFTERLGVPDAFCLAEYGMSEMCSQFYDSVLVDRLAPRRKLGPPWVRTRILDPRTGAEVEPGTPGVLCHYDLANLNSVLAIRTEDLGIAQDGGFTLLGRAPGTELRGCSLTAEEWHARA